MKKQVELLGRKVSVSLSASAVTALAQREQPIVAEMELYFSCLIRKKVRFRENLAGEVVNITEQLSVRFRPVMTAACGTDYEGDEPPLTQCCSLKELFHFCRFEFIRTRCKYQPRWSFLPPRTNEFVPTTS